MKNYESYTLADFIQDDDFRDWVRGYTHQEAFWAAFPRKYPKTKEAFRQAEQFVRAAAVTPERIGEAEIRQEVQQFIQTASQYNPWQSAPGKWPGEKPFLRVGSHFSRAMAGVAIIMVVGVGTWSFLDNPTTTDTPLSPQRSQPALETGQPLVETINHTTQPLRVVLNDNSEVVLSPKSSLRYPAQFAGQERIVYLTGEGTFSVKRQNRPFMVYTGETVTKVLGTRFVVRAFDLDRKITVQVLSGKVQVYKNNPSAEASSKEVNSLILNANQAAIFEKSDGNFTKTLVANPTVVAQSSLTETLFIYDETALTVILRELEKRYGIPIQFDEQNFEGCKITASLTNESLYEKLDLLCKAASATYEITDGQIVISRKNFK